MIRTHGAKLAVVACLTLVVLAIAMALQSTAANAQLSDVDPAYAVGAFACMVALVVNYAVCWWLLMRAIERRAVDAGPAIRMFCLSWVGRYLPASLPHYAGRLIAAPGAGMTRGAVAASLAYENLVVLAVGAAGTAVCLSLAAVTSGAAPAWIAAGAVLASLAFAALHPLPLRFVIDAASVPVRRLGALRAHVLSFRAVLMLSVPYAGGFVFAGLAYVLALRALGVSPPLLVTVAAYNMAGIAGMLAIGVPGGLGVREAVVVAIMSPFIAPADALAGAVLVRVVSIVADCVPALVSVAWIAVARWRDRPIKQVAPEPALAEHREAA